MPRIPKKCLTCGFSDFADDYLEELKCYHPARCIDAGLTQQDGVHAAEDDICPLYVTSEAVKVDAKAGCW
ncbi:MAG: hypothetical protein AB1763_04990 [Campylobacterota bacterium]